MSQTSCQATPNWVPGDSTASKLFDTARSFVRLRGQYAHSRIVWAGNAAICLAAIYLALPAGSPASAMFSMSTDLSSMSGFDLFASMALGWCVARVVELTFNLAAAKGGLATALLSLSAPAAEIMERAKRIEDGEPSEATLTALRLLEKVQRPDASK